MQIHSKLISSLRRYYIVISYKVKPVKNFSLTAEKLKTIFLERPIIRGMLAYSILWPTGSLIQQTIEGKRFENYDWKRCLRFSIYGSLFVAPTLYGWVRLTSAMWPQTNFRAGIAKAFVDQLAYGPFACSSFFIGMSLLEMKTFEEAIKELKMKFIPTFKIGICFWPVLQTINFSLVPERNRVLFVSICSLFWTTLLAYIKQLKDMETEVPKNRINF